MQKTSLTQGLKKMDNITYPSFLRGVRKEVIERIRLIVMHQDAVEESIADLKRIFEEWDAFTFARVINLINLIENRPAIAGFEWIVHKFTPYYDKNILDDYVHVLTEIIEEVKKRDIDLSADPSELRRIEYNERELTKEENILSKLDWTLLALKKINKTLPERATGFKRRSMLLEKAI